MAEEAADLLATRAKSGTTSFRPTRWYVWRGALTSGGAALRRVRHADLVGTAPPELAEKYANASRPFVTRAHVPVSIDRRAPRGSTNLK